MKLAKNLGVSPGGDEPGIRSVVKRRYAKGDIICHAAISDPRPSS